MMTKLSQGALRELADKAGLPEMAVTDARPFPEMIPWLEAYEQRGRTGFEAENIADRIDPKRWLVGAKSIIAVALPYLNETGRRIMRSHPVGTLYGSTSCYTYGDDYHGVLSSRLRQLHGLIEQYVGHQVEAKLSVDTSPLVDRRIAERSGLGWIGKNGMFYSNSYGSYVFLGAMLIDMEVDEYGEMEPNIGENCGTCTKCLLACPTGAIIAPGVIDATRCLSYITQMKGIIPKAFREKIGRRVWGCDVCQTTCPKNQDMLLSVDSIFGPEEELAYPSLMEILHLSNRAFMRKFGHTAMAWRGAHTLKRNALIAIGNTARREAVPAVIPFLSHLRSELRATAAWSLGKLGGDDAVAGLQRALSEEVDPAVVEEIREALCLCAVD